MSATSDSSWEVREEERRRCIDGGGEEAMRSSSQGTQTTIVDIQIHVLQKYKRLQMQRKRKKRDKPEELTPAAGNSIPQAILDGSDETNLFKTSPTEKNFNSGVGEKESKTEYYPLYSVSHIGRGGMMQDISKGG
uniref:Uncharacterized protein n=1 Tax=Oryza sativa subsp. japonica TaxID=39947 RepID=Q6UU87_ORYSJ|nr:hypothetical protein OSJNBa0074N12.5 [Oryza sativa Japonica Group]AAQ56495.1 hypothetical protein OSJNBa0023H09.10 [Oryza sativa Japonica Group]